MKAKAVLGGLLVAGLLLAAAAGVSGAHEAVPGRSGQAPGDAAPVGQPLGTGFTYQGRLTGDGDPVDGTCDFAFKLYDAAGAGSPPSGGTLLGTETKKGVGLQQGLFTVHLDFGGDAFNGQALWLEIAVDCGSGPTTLSPRQALTAAPYALHALGAPWSGLTDLPPELADGDDDTLGALDCKHGYIAKWDEDSQRWECARDKIDGGADDYWALGGNAGTTPPTNFLGTTDPVSLTLKVDDTVALRLEPSASTPNLIGGYLGNRVTPGVIGATIGGGGFGIGVNLVADDGGTVGGGGLNVAGEEDGDTKLSTNATVGGGWNNAAGGWAATVGGGADNTANGGHATVGGGVGNRASNGAAAVGGGIENVASGPQATVGGGKRNVASGEYAAVGGGLENTASGEDAFLGGGSDNFAGGEMSVIGGGENNRTLSTDTAIGGGAENTASGEYATIGGGVGNRTKAQSATIGGGESNVASGPQATVGGGSRNEALGRRAAVAGGTGNRASQDDTSIGGGAGNVASGDYATVGGGEVNEATGEWSTISGGDNNHATSWETTVSGGESNRATAGHATVGGGAANRASGRFSTVPGGALAAASHYGEMAYASGSFREYGAAQTSIYVLRQATTDDTPAYLFLDGNAEKLTIADGRTLSFEVLVAARSDGSDSAGYRMQGLIERAGSSTAFVGTPTVTVLGEDVTAWDATVEADSTDHALVIKVTGAKDTNIRWVATVRTAEVAWPAP